MSTTPRLVVCPTCRGSFPAGQGAISVCPRCGERVLVPTLDAEEALAPPESPAKSIPQPSPKPIASLPIECSLCGSRYYAKPDQIGQILPCPDCHTENVVPEPEAKKPATAPPPLDDDDDFKLSDPVDTPQYRALAADALEFERAIRSGSVSPTSPPPKPETVPSAAPPPTATPAKKPTSNPTRTGETASVRTAAIGKVPADEIELFPEDHLPPTVPQPKSVADQPAPDDDEDAPFNPQLSEVFDRPQHRSVPRLPKPDPLDDDDGSDFGKSLRKFFPTGPAPEVPKELAAKRPFSRGIFSFLLQPAVLGRWLFLAMLVMIELYATGVITNSFTTASGERGVAQAQILGIIIYVVASIPGFLGAMAIAATSLAILQDTSNGDDVIESWQPFLQLEWIGGVFYMLAAVFVSGLPAVILFLLFNAVGIPGWLAAILIYPSVFLLFPPIMLSMMEADSVSVPLTSTMARSFLPLRRFWTTFYLATIGLGFAGIVALFTAYKLGVVTIVISGLVLTALPFLYFRLLGRMAMVYRDYVFATTPEEDDDSPSQRHVLQ